MEANELGESELDPDRHYATIVGKVGPSMVVVKVRCGSMADVLVSQIRGGFIMELEEDEGVDWRVGPLFLDCAKHGKYMGLWQILAAGSATPTGQKPVSVAVLMIPWPDVECVLPLSTAQWLLNDSRQYNSVT